MFFFVLCTIHCVLFISCYVINVGYTTLKDLPFVSGIVCSLFCSMFCLLCSVYHVLCNMSTIYFAPLLQTLRRLKYNNFNIIFSCNDLEET